jgi:hypothetical protein
MVNHPDSDAAKLASLISRDQAVAAHLLCIASLDIVKQRGQQLILANVG